MRRAPIVLAATVLGTAGVLLFKPLPTSAVVGTTDAAGASTSDGSSSGSPSTDSSSSSGSSSSEPSSTPSSGTSSGGAAGTAKDGTYTGDAKTVRYGTTQVKVVIDGGRITDVAVVQENQEDGRSVQISESAFPTLREEVLQAQKADVDTVSGATYTSLQYEASLQSALDRAGFTAADGSTASTDVSNVEGGGGGFGR